MAQTQEILNKATELGKMLAEHETARRLEAVIQRLEKDTDAQQSLTAYNQFLQTLARKEMSGQPIEVEEKRKLQSLQTAVVHNLTIREFQMAQMAYAELMRQVDQALTSESANLLPGLGPGQGAQPQQPAQAPLVNPDVSPLRG